MQPGPSRFDRAYAQAFQELQVVEAYQHRPPYPQEVFALLASLVLDEPRAVLDVGSGSGDIARSLAPLVERVDAVDFSQRMIERGKQLPNGSHPRLHWISGKIEEIPLAPPYALITAGSSIHWTEWEVAFPRFREILTRNGSLALIYRRTLPLPWEGEIRTILAHFSDRQGSGRTNTITALEARGFFHRQGEKETAPVAFAQSLDDYIDGLHARSRFSRERIGQQRAADLDEQVRALLLQFHPDGMLPLQVIAEVTWGKPGPGDAR